MVGPLRNWPSVGNLVGRGGGLLVISKRSCEISKPLLPDAVNAVRDYNDDLLWSVFMILMIHHKVLI